MLRALPLEQWPAADRRAWRVALRRAQRLSGGGAAAHLRTSTKVLLERSYGYFLRVLSDRGALNIDAATAAHVTPEGIENFVEQAELSWNSVTVASGVEKVRTMAQKLAPERDFRWLNNIEAQLRAKARPREKFSRMVATEKLVEAGLVLLQKARDAKPRSAEQATTFGNGLTIALLAVCPIRVGSFASLTLGRSFLRVGDGWWIRLSADETKSGRPDERPVPSFLTSCVDEYLRSYRPRFLSAGCADRAGGNGAALPEAAPELVTGPLRMSLRGRAMSLETMKMTITQTTRQALGVSVNPHLFRACAATTASLHAAAHPHLASALLQHVDVRTTEAHYIRASSLQAAIRYGRIVDEILSEKELDAPSSG
jgi:integrase